AVFIIMGVSGGRIFFPPQAYIYRQLLVDPIIILPKEGKLIVTIGGEVSHECPLNRLGVTQQEAAEPCAAVPGDGVAGKSAVETELPIRLLGSERIGTNPSKVDARLHGVPAPDESHI